MTNTSSYRIFAFLAALLLVAACFFILFTPQDIASAETAPGQEIYFNLRNLPEYSSGSTVAGFNISDNQYFSFFPGAGAVYTEGQGVNIPYSTTYGLPSFDIYTFMNFYVSTVVVRFDTQGFLSLDLDLSYIENVLSDSEVSFTISEPTNFLTFSCSSTITLTSVTFVGVFYNPHAFQDGYNSGYSSGKNDGINSANNTVTPSSASYAAGYNAGVSAASDYSFYSLIGAVIDVPLQAFTSLFNFEILGVNMRSFATSIFTILILIAVGKLSLSFFS